MNPLSFFAVLASAVYLETGFHALSLDRESRTNRVVFALGLVLALWAASQAFIYGDPEGSGARIWYFIATADWFVFAPLGLHFCLGIAHRGRRRRLAWLAAIYLPGLFLGAACLLALVEGPGPRGLFATDGRAAITLRVASAAYCLLYLGLGVRVLAMARKRATTVPERKRLGLLLAAILVPCTLAFITDTLHPAMGYGLPRLSIFWCLLWVAGIRYDMYRYGFMAPFRNMTDAGRLFSMFIKRSLDGIVITDEGGQVAVWGGMMETITGKMANDVIGHDLAEIQLQLGTHDNLPGNAGGRSGAALTAFLAEALRSNGANLSGEIAENQIVNARGEGRWLQSLAFTISLSGGRCCLAAIIRDVTEEHEASLTAQEERKRLERAERMEAVGNLAAGLSHDFNNTLMSIKGTVALLRLGLEEGPAPAAEELRAAFDSIDASTVRGVDVVRQLLALAQKQPVERKLLSLATAVGEAVERAGKRLDPSVSIELAPIPRSAVIKAGTEAMAIVLANLVDNAADSMTVMRRPEETRGGRIFVSARHGRADEGLLQKHPGAVPDHWIISVRDEGVGIPEAELSRVFDPFYTTKLDSASRGLGLSKVYAIAESHGGFVEVRSKPGEGSEFLVYFPCAAGGGEGS